jgi:hypothetical protein
MKQLLVALCLSVLNMSCGHAQQSYSLFSSQTPATLVEADTNTVSLGLKFYSSTPGTISAIRFYRGHANSNGYTSALYTSGGSLLGQVRLPSDSKNFRAGWKVASFASPISISPNTVYIAVYYSSNGDYAVTNFGLENNNVVNGPLTAPDTNNISGGNGVYSYGGGLHFPNHTYQGSNYFVDVVFTPSSTPPPTLSLNVSPSAPSIPATSPIGMVVATVSAVWSDNSLFTGTYGFMAPYNNDGGTFALSGSSGASVNLIVNAPLTSDAGTVQNVTVGAMQ